MNAFKQLLGAAGGHPPVGTWISSASPLVAEAVAHAGFDWGVIDMEHSPLDMMDVVHLLQAVSSSRMVPVVRVPWNDTVTIKRVLDAGATTLLVPFVQSADEALRAVAATRYPPQGIRGVSVSQRSNRYGTVPDYFQSVNDHICVAVQIESRAGVAAAREIAALDDVDCLFIGPSDLAAALGHLGNASHPDVQAAIASVFADAQAFGKPVGILAPLELDARRYMAMGATFVAVGSDLGAFRSATQALLERYRH